MRCAGDPACAFPVVIGEDRCREHLVDSKLPITLHETSCDGYLRTHQDSWGGFSISNDRLGYTAKRGRPKLTDEEKLIRAAQRAKYMNTYCRAFLPAKLGEVAIRCNTAIPIDETICEQCKHRLMPLDKD